MAFTSSANQREDFDLAALETQAKLMVNPSKQALSAMQLPRILSCSLSKWEQAMQLEAELQQLLQNIRSQTVRQTTNACSLGTADGFPVYRYILDGVASTEVSYNLADLTL